MRQLALMASMVLVGGWLVAGQGLCAGGSEPGMVQAGGSAMMEEVQPQHMAAQPLDMNQVRELQSILKQKGFDPGALDGTLGPQTLQAIRDFQTSVGLTATGTPDKQTLQALAPDAATQEFFGLAPEFGENQGQHYQSPMEMQQQPGQMEKSSEGTKKMDRY